MTEDRYDVAVTAGGACGGAMAWKRAQTGKRIRLVERGDSSIQTPPASAERMQASTWRTSSAPA